MSRPNFFFSFSRQALVIHNKLGDDQDGGEKKKTTTKPKQPENYSS